MRRLNPYRVKLHFSYSTAELAARFGVHKNTVRNWQREGLTPIDSRRPVVFHGATIRDFLERRNASRKCPCPLGSLYCFRCRAPRPPALGMVDYVAHSAASGNVRAICATCETVMHRRVRMAALAAILPGCDVQFAQAPSRLNDTPCPSLNCDSERKATR